jgi:hypothetical protein
MLRSLPAVKTSWQPCVRRLESVVSALASGAMATAAARRSSSPAACSTARSGPDDSSCPYGLGCTRPASISSARARTRLLGTLAGVFGSSGAVCAHERSRTMPVSTTVATSQRLRFVFIVIALPSVRYGASMTATGFRQNLWLPFMILLLHSSEHDCAFFGDLLYSLSSRKPA